MTTILSLKGNWKRYNMLLFCFGAIIIMAAVSGCVDPDNEFDHVPDSQPGVIHEPVIPPSPVPISSGMVTDFVRQLPVDDPGIPSPDPVEPIPLRTTDTTRTYRWHYQGSYYTLSVPIPADRYNYLALLPRDKPHPSDYVMSDRGRGELHQVIEDFIALAEAQKLSETERRDMVIAFVQSLPENRRGTLRNYDDYPKYPLQTLYDGGGDSQDTAILLTALLRLFGLPASLLETPNHYAVLLPLTEQDKAQNYVYIYQKDASTLLKGNYLDDNNNIRDFYHGDAGVIKDSYVYIESQFQGYPIGTLPSQFKPFIIRTLREKYYRPESIIAGGAIHHPKRTPKADFSFNARLVYLDPAYAYYQVYSTIHSLGTGHARDLRVRITARPADHADTSWEYRASKTAPVIPEGHSRLLEATVQIPRNTAAQIECVLSGPGIAEKKRVSQVFYT